MNMNDFAGVILASPGMLDLVKFDLKHKRKLVLLMCGMALKGLNVREEGGAALLLEDLPKEVVDEVVELIREILEKAGLSELHTALKALGKAK